MFKDKATLLAIPAVLAKPPFVLLSLSVAEHVCAFGEQAEETIRVNYFSLRRVCTALYPLLRLHARVVHISSSAGRLSNITGDAKKKIDNPNLTEAELDKIMHEFVK